MSHWNAALDGLDVATLAPSRDGGAVERGTPEEALRRAGGLPATSRATPLLVAVNDPARATRSVDALPAIRAAAGSRLVRLLIATGSHRFPEDVRERFVASLREAVGAPVEVRWHDGEEDANVSVAEWRVDPWLAEAADVVAVGSVEPHWFAGLTGSYKTLSVGVLARSSIERSHRLALETSARPLRLEGNPVHEEIARTVRALLAGRAVLALDHLGDRWVAGDPLENVRTLLPAARGRWGCRVPAPLDFLVTRVRPPLDGVLYQADKGLKNSEHAVRDGGAIVIDAACGGGVGPRRFLDLLAAAPDEAAAREAIERDGYRLGDHKAVRWRALQGRGVAIAAVAPGFPGADAAAAGLHVLDDAAAAGRWLTARFQGRARGAVVEDAAHTIVEVEE